MNRKFRVSVVSQGTAPRGLVSRIRQAAKLTLEKLPRKALTGMDPDETYTLNLSLIGSAKMKELNGTYRQKHYATDVLSFSTMDSPALPSAVLEVGEVILCLPTLRRQARDYGVSLAEEAARLTIHGTLHCFGYDHERSKAEAKRMFRLQNQILNLLVSLRSDRSRRPAGRGTKSPVKSSRSPRRK